MPTTTTKTVKPAGGGDYVSLNAFELAERANLVTGDNIRQADCYSGGNLLTAALNISSASWTTSATQYIDFTVHSGEQHSGIWTTGKAYCSISGGANAAIQTSKYLHLNKLQIENTACTSGNGAVRNNAAVKIVMDRCFVRFSCAAAAGSNTAVYASTTSADIDITNCFIINYSGATNGHVYCVWNTHATVTCYSSTLIALNLLGAGKSSGGFTVDNASSVTTEDSNYLNGTSNYLVQTSGTFNKGTHTATSNADAVTSGLRSFAYNTTNFTDITSTAEDLHIPRGSALEFAGVTISGVTVDIEGQTRQEPPSIGGDDFGSVTDTGTCVDGAILSDSDSYKSKIKAVATDGTKLSDSCNRASRVFAHAIDALIASDSPAATRRTPVSVNDGVILSDSNSRRNSVTESCTDGVKGSESTNRRSTAFVDVLDPRYKARKWPYRRSDA